MRSVDILVGGQFGSEGKGKFMAYLAQKHDYDFAVRSGGPNAGHTFYRNGKKHVTRHLPCSVANVRTKLYLAPSALINPSLLEEELADLGDLNPLNRLFIDNQAGIISKKHIDATDPKRASTKQGVGAAQAEKTVRQLRMVRDDSRFNRYNKIDVVSELNHLIDSHRCGIVEGVQGCELSLNNHWYPFCTSRDVYASSLLSDCGLSPYVARDIYIVLRTYPIRFGGKSGPMGAQELSWEEITKRSGSENLFIERSTVGNIPRRISEFSWSEAQRAVKINRPTKLCLSFIDYISYDDYGVTEFRKLSNKSRSFVEEVENKLQVPVSIISTGPYGHQIIDRV